MKQPLTNLPCAEAPQSRSYTTLQKRWILCWAMLICAIPPVSFAVLLTVSGNVSPLPTILYILAILILFWSASRFFGRGWMQGLALLIGCLNLIVLSPELFLRVIDFQHVSSVSYGALRPERRESFVPDSDLMWKFSPAEPGVNSFGFHGNEVQIPKPRGVRRILFIGDSCTDQDFARHVEQLLNQNSRQDGVRYECVIMAVPGYSSYQGKVIAEKYGALCEADVAFVYFGWNDHWLAYGGTDSELGQGRLPAVMREIYHYSRLAQLAMKISQGSHKGVDSVINRVRVPAQEFRANLFDISSALTDAGARVVFVTAPSDHSVTGVPKYFIEQKLAPDESFVLNMHAEYCEIVRSVAAQTSSDLLDLEAEMTALDQGGLFAADGIHFTDTGLRMVSAMIYSYLLDCGQF